VIFGELAVLNGGPVRLDSVDQESASAEFLEIRIATRSVPIRIEYAAIRSLHSVIPGQDQSLGLLLGIPSSEALSIDHCEQLPQDPVTIDGFTRAWSKHPAQRVVGFFRTQRAGWPEIRNADRDIARRCFQSPGSLFLLIQTPDHRPWSAALFDLDAKGASTSKTPAPEFFFDEYLLRSGYSTAPAPGPEQQAMVDPPLARSRSYRVVLAMLGSALLLGLIGYQWFAGKDRAESASVQPAASPLSLKVMRVGQDYEISWDHLAPALQQATAGTVTVRDGEINRTVPLNTAQLREGRILYTPLFGDLNFRLEIQQGARTQAESVQVLSWNGNSPSALLGNLPATPPESVVPRRSAPPSSAIRQSRSGVAADVRLRPMTGESRTPPSQSTPAPFKGVVPTSADSTPVALTQPAVAKPEADPEPSQAKPSVVAPAQLPAIVAAVPVPQPSAFLDKPAEVRSAGPRSVPATGAGSVSGGPAPPPEKPAVAANPVPPPAPASAAPNASNAQVSVPQPSDLSYQPPVAVTRASPRLSREVNRAVTIAGGKVNISVRVTVDANGNVRNAEVLPQSKTSTFVDFLFLKSAVLDAAKDWKFRPAKLNGKAIASEITLEFHFQ
jgi:TonB family protein